VVGVILVLQLLKYEIPRFSGREANRCFVLVRIGDVSLEIDLNSQELRAVFRCGQIDHAVVFEDFEKPFTIEVLLFFESRNKAHWDLIAPCGELIEQVTSILGVPALLREFVKSPLRVERRGRRQTSDDRAIKLGCEQPAAEVLFNVRSCIRENQRVHCISVIRLSAMGEHLASGFVGETRAREEPDTGIRIYWSDRDRLNCTLSIGQTL